MQKEVQNLVDQKLSAIDLAEKLFKDAIKNKDEALKEVLNKWLNSLNVIDGKIDRETNRKLLNTLNKALRAKINKSTLTSPVKSLLKVFDTVENYTKKTLEIENSIDLSKYDLSEEKKQAISEITDTLLNDDVLNANVTQQLKKIAFRHVQTGISFQDAQKEFEKVLDGNPLAKYARVITAEAIHRYDGMINQRVATDYKLDAFRIVGSLISTSQPVCINMIKESGPFAGMAINGKYPIKELPAILRIVNSYPSAVPGTNESNYFINRNHWGCRHVFIPTRFTAKDLQGIPAGVINNVENPPVNNPFEVRIDNAKNAKNVSEVLKDVFKENFDVNAKITTPQSTLPFDDYKEYAKHISKLAGEYKSSNKGADEVAVKFRSTEGKIGYVLHGYSAQEIRNLNFFDSQAYMKENDRKIFEINFGNRPHVSNNNLGIRRWSPKIDPENKNLYTITHEFAHFTAISKNKAGSKFFEELKEIQKGYYDKLASIKDKESDEYDKVFLGRYANTNIDEFLAEGFTSYKLSSNPPEVAVKIGQLFDKYFKR